MLITTRPIVCKFVHCFPACSFWLFARLFNKDDLLNHIRVPACNCDLTLNFTPGSSIVWSCTVNDDVITDLKPTGFTWGSPIELPVFCPSLNVHPALLNLHESQQRNWMCKYSKQCLSQKCNILYIKWFYEGYVKKHTKQKPWITLSTTQWLLSWSIMTSNQFGLETVKHFKCIFFSALKMLRSHKAKSTTLQG